MFVQDDKDKESSALPDQYDETAFDVAEKPPAFLDGMQVVKAKL